MVRPRLLLPSSLLALGLIATACGSDDETGTADTTAAGSETADVQAEAVATCLEGSPVAEGERLRIASTVAPITSIVANIAGDTADIVGLVPEGTNSHTFEPPPSVAATLAKSDVVFVNGLILEEPTKD